MRVARGADMVNVFALVDLDGNGKVTAREWRRAPPQLDVNRRDGVLTDDELRPRRTPRVPRRQRSRPDATSVSATGVRRAAKTATNEGCGISKASGSSNRPMRAIAAGWARATSTQAGYREGFRQVIRGKARTAPWDRLCRGALCSRASPPC
ncbi:MAG: EF-hand domain-containing protein [Ignavibacteriales bacterium]|nr:EF-hand domain-containing protein [Ignavibacteriales bacterium]